MKRIRAFNDRFALVTTNFVGSMWCAYIFAIIAFWGLPAALSPGGIGLLYWISGDFLQLTLLSVIIVGQNLQASKTAELHQAVKEHHRLMKEIHAKLHRE